MTSGATAWQGQFRIANGSAEYRCAVIKLACTLDDVIASMTSSIISGLIGGLASVVICSYISANVRGSATRGALRYGAWLVVLGWCCLAFVGLAGWALFYDLDVWERRSELYSVIGLIVGFGTGAAYCFGEYFFTRGTYDDDGIDFSTPWTGRKTERWHDLIAVDFNATANWYVLTFRSGNKIRISTMLSGHGAVLDVLDAKASALHS